MYICIYFPYNKNLVYVKKMKIRNVLIILVIIIAILALGYYFTNATGNQVNFDVPSGFNISDTSNDTILLTDGTTRIKVNEVNYSESLDDLVNKFYDNYSDLNITNSSKELSDNLTVKSVRMVNFTDVQNHYWYNLNGKTYHIYMNGDNQDAVETIIKSTK